MASNRKANSNEENRRLCSTKNTNPDQNFVKVPLIQLNYVCKVNYNLFEANCLIRKWYPHLRMNKAINCSNDFLTIAAYSFPDASLDLLLTFTKCMVCSFMFDDCVVDNCDSFEETFIYANKFLNLFDQADVKKANQFSLYCTIMIEIAMNLRRYASEQQMHRFRDAIGKFFRGTSEEIFKINTGANLHIGEFMMIRIRALFVEANALFVELSSECDMSEFEDDQLFVTNRESVGVITMLLNDIYSFNRDWHKGIMANFVIKMAKVKQISNQEAINKALDMLWEVKMTFDRTSNQMINKFSKNKNVVHYVNGLQSYINASRLWNIYSDQYSKYNAY